MCVLPLAAAASVRFCVTLDVRIAQHKQKKRGGSGDETWSCKKRIVTLTNLQWALVIIGITDVSIIPHRYQISRVTNEHVFMFLFQISDFLDSSIKRKNI